MQDHLLPLGWLFSPALQRSLQSSSPNIDWCTLYAANCVHSSCFVLLLCLSVCVFVYLLQLIYFFFVCLCVHLFIYNNFDILSYFSAWPSHAARLALPISEFLCSLFFHNNFLLCLNTVCIKSTIKIVVLVVDICHIVIKLLHAHPWAVMTELDERLYCPIAEWTRPNHPPLQRSPTRDHHGRH